MKSFIFYIVLLKTYCECANILAYIPTASYSHQIPFQPLWRELSLRGHKLTVLTTNPINDPSLTNLTEIDLSFTYDIYAKHNFSKIWNKGIRETGRILNEIFNEQFEAHFSYEPVKKLINDKNSKFDLFIVEAQLMMGLGFAWRFQCPFIGVSSLDAAVQFHESMGNIVHPLTNPDNNLKIEDASNLTFFERLKSAIYYIMYRLSFLRNHIRIGNEIVRKHFGENVPTLREIQKNMSMLFVSTHPVFHNTRAVSPNTIEIGTGMHIKPPKPLPKNLKKFLDEAKNGVIYFSLGSNVKGDDLNDNLKSIIIEVFRELPYNILWKIDWDGKGVPNNVHIEKWLPQQDVLRHPHIKLFITQGGIQSMQEALFNKIPLIGIPFFGDQFSNVQKMIKRGYGLKLNRENITKENFRETILEVLTNPSYKEKAEEMGNLLQDEPTTSLERAIWWIEYVIRHKGAPLFKSNAVEMPLWKYCMLDIIGFVGIFLIVFIYCTFKLFKFIIRKVFSTKVKSE